MPRLRLLARVLVAIGIAAGTTTVAAAQEPYRRPPQVVQDVLDAPPLPFVGFSYDRQWMVLAARASYPSIEELAQPMLRLAGRRINPRTNGPHRGPRFTGFTLKRIADGTERRVETPAGAALSAPQFSPDGRHLLFTVARDAGVELWIAATETGQAWAATEPVINTAMAGCGWMPDGAEVVCARTLAGRGPAPARPLAPAGPTIQRNDGRRAAVRTYQDLLESPFDEQLFTYYGTSQLIRINVTSRQVRTVGAPGMLLNPEPSPDGRYLLVTSIQRPFSYAVPANLFPLKVEVWSADGTPVRTLAELPLGDQIPQRGVRAGPRGVSWRPDRPATLTWIEALDQGDPSRPAEQRDRVVMTEVPGGPVVELARVAQRAGQLRWLQRGDLALLSETDRPARRTRLWLLETARAGAAPRLVHERQSEDAYADIGSPAFVPTPGGAVVLTTADGLGIYLTGAGASPEGDRPFLDRLDLATMRTTRLWRSEAPHFESVVAVLDAGAQRVITARQSRTEPSNYALRDLRARTDRALTAFRDPAPQLQAVRREQVTARRPDGVQLTGTLYTPPGWQAGQRVPLVMWVYPAEFASADAAGQVRGSPHRFTTIGGASHLFFLTQGYAVLDNPSLPVIGGDTANNGYVRQVVLGAQAWIDRMVELGVTDRERVAVGGHSYGAFTTANLLAHSDLFRAGIARSGAYNRTLTPFGFQAEQRTLWQSPDVYLAMSPFMYADRINEPILLIHGEADDNSGTFPVQSERLYAALQGHGATVEFVQYPHEAHGYQARETLMDCVARMIQWLDRYVKNAGPRPAVSTTSGR